MLPERARATITKDPRRHHRELTHVVTTTVGERERKGRFSLTASMGERERPKREETSLPECVLWCRGEGGARE